MPIDFRRTADCRHGVKTKLDRTRRSLWCESWEPGAKPHQQSRAELPDGAAKLLTLLLPASGQVLGKGVTSSTNAVLHSWLQPREIIDWLEAMARG